MHTFERHVCSDSERDLFGAISGTLAALAARFVAEEQALAAEVDAIKALGMVVESRDSEVKGHIDRVTELAERVGYAMHLGAEALSAVRRGAYLHDLGKVSTPDAILHKRGALSPEERLVMQQHAEVGHYVAQQLAFLPQATLDTILYHHERWDGHGLSVRSQRSGHPADGARVCGVRRLRRLDLGKILQTGLVARRRSG
jgi:putative nucleotidyltransferase with HDIG domain